MTHEERARALVPASPQLAARIAAAFAQVEAAEKARLIAMADAEKDCAHAGPPGCWEESVEGSIYCAAHQGDDSFFGIPPVTLPPDSPWLPKPCACHSGVPCPNGFFSRGLGDPPTIREAITQAVAELHAVSEPNCTCGAASCGSRLHSDYCDSFGVV
jgi:hypothetical protein